jgi:Tol biopolymer transport system component
MTATGENPRNVSMDGGDTSGSPAWSPDGTLIAFSSNRDLVGWDFDIWVMPAQGGPAIQLTSSPESESAPSWSPDGSRIAFVRYSASTQLGDIWVVPATGGTAAQLTTHPGNDSSPAWSPDGSKIAFQSTRSGNLEIWVMDLTPTSVEPTTWGAIKGQFAPED